MKRALLLLVLMLSPGLLLQPALGQEDDRQPETAGEAPLEQPVPEPDPAAALREIEQAYQKEFALLVAQRDELEQRLARFRERTAAEINRAETDIDELEGAINGLQSRAGRLNDLLTEADRNITTIEENRDTLEATFQQATATLDEHDRPVPKADFAALDDVVKIRYLFQDAVALLQQSGQVRRISGRYYLLDGTEVEGDILQVGRIAAYGLSNRQAGLLAPAGEGRYKLWRKPAADTAKTLAAGRRPETLPIFLFESLDRPIEENPARGLFGTINAGGTIAWIITGLGLIALAMIVLRLLFLRRASRATGEVLEQSCIELEQGRPDQALEVCRRHGGATGRVMAAAIRNLDRDREHVEDIVSEAILHENAHLNRFGAVILVIAAVAPLLGLLGTVTGMITTFDIITEFGTGDPKLLSGGISIALITTEVGLAVAIPALIFGNLLSGWAESIKDSMEKAALRVINLAQASRV